MTERKRLPGKWVAAGVLGVILAIVAGALGLWFRGREPAGRIVAMTPLDARRVLLLREGYQQHGYVHFSLRDLDRGQVWSVPFHDVPAGAKPVVAARRAMTWVRNDSGDLEIHAFDLDSGRFAFRASRVRVPSGVTPNVSMIAVADHVVAGYALSGKAHALVVDATSGRELATHELGIGSTAPGMRVVGVAVELTSEDGAPRRVDARHGSIYVLPPGFAAAVPEAPTVSLAGGVACAVGIAHCLVATDSGRRAPFTQAERVAETLWAVSGSTVAAVDLVRGRLLGGDGPLDVAVGPPPPPQ